MKTYANTKDRIAPPTHAQNAARKPNRLSATRKQNQAIRDIILPPVQTHVTVGKSGDRYEQEADAVANKVLAGQPVPVISRLPASVLEAPPQRQSGDYAPGAGPEQASHHEPAKPKPNGNTDQTNATAYAAISNKNPGSPLRPAVRDRLEASMGVDLGGVRMHDDSAAQQAAKDLHARAFTYGRDIWLGGGESQQDIHLMAHEATHVVQQGSAPHPGPIQRQRQRAEAPVSESGSRPGSEIEKAARSRLETFRLPPIKLRHRPVYEAWSASGRLKRVAGYERGNPNQKDAVWLPNINLPDAHLKSLDLDASFKGKKTIEVHGKSISGSYRQLVNKLKVPNWSRTGQVFPQPLEVDHIVELQVGDWNGSGPANTLENMELLDKRSNTSAGGSTRASISENVAEYRRAIGAPNGSAEVARFLKENSITFRRVEVRDSGRSDAASDFWTRAEIEHGDHLGAARPRQNVGEAGTADSFALLSPSKVSLLGEYPHDAAQQHIRVDDTVGQKRVAGLNITAIELNGDATQAAQDSIMGMLHANWDLPADVSVAQQSLQIPLLSHRQYAGYLGPLPSLQAQINPLNRSDFNQPVLDDGAISATARTTPAIPLLGKTTMDVGLSGTRLEFSSHYNTEQLSLPIPGLTVTAASLDIYYGADGFGADGSLDFSFSNLGQGRLIAGAKDGALAASGEMTFAPGLFDRSVVEIWYRDRAFGARGVLGIDKADKVPGIRSAEVTAEFEKGGFSANGMIEANVPGVEQAELGIRYSETEGLLIAGSLGLSNAIPGLSSGNIGAQVRKKPHAEGYHVSAQGTAQSSIPGVETAMKINYEDGVFNAQSETYYQRGMLSGSILLGATNRIVDAKGVPRDEVGNEIFTYGGGSVIAQIAPWLQGRAGITLLRSGEVEMLGEIGLPAALDLFPQKLLEKNIFNINLDIPIVGFAVAGQRIGIFATVGGGLDANAAIGPGQLTGLKLGIIYNPDHEDQTQINGEAKLRVPAEAGLRLFVRGALGAGIPVVSASLGLEVGGALGVDGAAEAGVQLDWSPHRGLILDTQGEIYAQPKFRFDLSGFAKVDADLLVSSIELYNERWQLSAFEAGPDLSFGVKFPLYYQEGQRFDIALSAVEFDVPDIDVQQVLRTLIKKIV